MPGGDVCVYDVNVVVNPAPSPPPLSLRDISPTRGEISGEFSVPSVSWPTKFMAISPLEGEMSRRDRGGYVAAFSKLTPVPHIPANSR